MIRGLIHEKGSKFHVDIDITRDFFSNGDEQFYLSQMIEYRCQEIRGENFYIYKIEDLEVDMACKVYRNIARKIRISCVKLADPKILLRKPRQQAGALI